MEENTRVGDRVRFSSENVFLPDPQPSDAHPAASQPDEQGTIVAFSDSGPVRRVFAVLETVQGRTVVVPVDKLRLEDEEQGGKDLA